MVVVVVVVQVVVVVVVVVVAEQGFIVCMILIFCCIFFWICLCFPWFSEHSPVAVTVLRLCWNYFFVYFSPFFCVFSCFVLQVFRFPGVQNLLARLENLADSKPLPQRCTYSINLLFSFVRCGCRSFCFCCCFLLSSCLCLFKS